MAKPKLPPGASRLPSGKIRLQIRDPRTGERISPRAIDPSQPASYDTPDEAMRAYVHLTESTQQSLERGVTVRDFWQDWTDEDHYLYGRKRKPQTLATNRTRTKRFIDEYGDLPMHAVDGTIVDRFMRNGGRHSHVQGLRAMFQDALDADPPLVLSNPFGRLGKELDRIEKRRRTRERKLDPAPSEQEIQALLEYAGDVIPPMAWALLYVACWTGARPGEVFAMKWKHYDPAGSYRIAEAFETRTRRMTDPKWDSDRTIELRPGVVAVLEDLRAQRGSSPYIFTTSRGTHWNHESFGHWWDKVRHRVNGTKLYNATRAFFITWAVDHGVAPHDLAEHVGHKDNGALLMDTYYRPRQKDTRSRRSMRDLYASQPIDLSAERARRRESA